MREREAQAIWEAIEAMADAALEESRDPNGGTSIDSITSMRINEEFWASIPPDDPLPAGWEWEWQDVTSFCDEGYAWVPANRELQLTADDAPCAWRQAAASIEGDGLIDEDPTPPECWEQIPGDRCQMLGPDGARIVRNRDAWAHSHGWPELARRAEDEPFDGPVRQFIDAFEGSQVFGESKSTGFTDEDYITLRAASTALRRIISPSLADDVLAVADKVASAMR